jgi:hypothetical protein
MQVTGTIVTANRLNNSTNGNPRFRVVIRDTEGQFDTYTTSTDAAVGYEIENLLRSGAVTTFELTKAGRISYRVR